MGVFDTSGLENWMEADVVESAAGELSGAGGAYSTAVGTVAQSWSPIGIAYVKGVGREDMLNAMVNPQLHGKAVKILTEQCAKELSQLATELTEYYPVRRDLLAEIAMWDQAVQSGDLPPEGEYEKALYEEQKQAMQNRIDNVASSYTSIARAAADRIQAISTSTDSFRREASKDTVLDDITGPMGSELTPAIGMILKFIRPGRDENGKLIFKDGDKWKVPKSWPEGLQKFSKSTWGKWMTKFTTPISWGLNYADQFQDSAVTVVMEHPDWSTEQVANRVWQETGVKGTTRSVTGTIISEVTSTIGSKVGAAGGAAIGTAAAPGIGTAIGAVAGFVLGSAANHGMRESGAATGIASWSQNRVDDVTGGGPVGRPEWAPDPYPYPAQGNTYQPPPADPFPRLPEPTPRPPDPTPPSTGLPNPYTVKKGDYLEKIAAEYGTSWPRVYEANKEKIDNPDLIYPGQQFDIPVP